jgi:NAD(P)-dependent dehydrogenase (short-subunit alcohol dehydrogenase family)
MGKLDGKVALVTGAGRGLGRGIARALACEGARIVLAARNAQELQTTEEELTRHGAPCLIAPTDVTDEGQVEVLFGRAIEGFGKLDLLVNNAGAFDGGPIDQLSIADWDKVIAVNLRAPFLCTRAAMRIMKRQGVGRIVNIGSISAQRVRPDSAPYSASKHGLWGLTQVTALEGREHGITCGCLHPGNVLVERRQTLRNEDAEPMMSVEEVAEVVVLMAALPPHVQMLEAVVLPSRQLFVGRG